MSNHLFDALTAFIPGRDKVFMKQADGTVLTYRGMLERSAQYAGALPLADQLGIVTGAVGKSGRNPDYVLSTAAHLEELGIADHNVGWLADQLKG